MKNNCIFCEITAGSMPSFKLYEDDDILIILDRFPKAKGHTLIMPKTHYTTIFDLDQKVGMKIFAAAQKMSQILMDTLKCDGINLVQNNGEVAGQQVAHFHLHIVPRFESDNLVLMSGKTVEISEDEFTELVDKMRFEA